MNEKQINRFLNIWIVADYLSDDIDHYSAELSAFEPRELLLSHWCKEGRLESIELHPDLGSWYCKAGECHKKFGYKKFGSSYGTITQMVCLLKKCSKDEAIKWVNDLIEKNA